MKTKVTERIPEEILEHLRRAGRARWEGVSPAERRAHGLRAWKTRLARLREAKPVLVTGRTLAQ
jgi:hypothetical protein